MNDSNDKSIEYETLLDIAERNYKAGVNNWQTFPDDDGMLNIVGYHFQQTVELALKHILETHTIKYPKTHDISDLLEELPMNYPNIFTDVEKYANKITTLESRTRYVKGYRAKAELIKIIDRICYNLLQNIRDIERREDILINKEDKTYSKGKHECNEIT